MNAPRTPKPITERIEISRFEAIWIVEGHEERGGPVTSMSYLALARLPDGSGQVMNGCGEADDEPDFYVVPKAFMGRVIENDLHDAAESVAKRLAEAGRAVTTRFIEIRSDDPAVLARRLEGTGLTLHLAPRAGGRA